MSRERERERVRSCIQKRREMGRAQDRDSHLLLILGWVLISGQIHPLLNSLIGCPLWVLYKSRKMTRHSKRTVSIYTTGWICQRTRFHVIIRLSPFRPGTQDCCTLAPTQPTQLPCTNWHSKSPYPFSVYTHFTGYETATPLYRETTDRIVLGRV